MNNNYILSKLYQKPRSERYTHIQALITCITYSYKYPIQTYIISVICIYMILKSEQIQQTQIAKKPFMSTVTSYQKVHAAIQTISRGLKIIKKQYHEKTIDQLYQLWKTCSSIITQYTHQKQQQKLPQFYQNMHETTVRMRVDLLNKIKQQQNKAQKMHQNYEKYAGTLKNELDDKNRLIEQLQLKIQHIAILNDYRGQGNTIMVRLQAQNRDLRDKNKKMQNRTCVLQKQLQQKQSIINKLQQQGSNKKEGQYNNMVEDIRASSKIDSEAAETNNKHKYNDSLRSEQFANQGQSHSSSQVNQYCYKPCYGNSNSHRFDKIVSIPTDDDIWRLVLIQASSIEQYLAESYPDQSQLL